MKRIGVIICGDAFLDKIEIHETELVINALKNNNAMAAFFTHFYSHGVDNNGFTGGVAEESLKVVNIFTGLTSYPLSDLSEIEKFMPDALIILSANSVPVYFETKENSIEYESSSKRYMDLLKKLYKKNLTIGFVGKSAILAPLLTRNPVRATLGNDPDCAELIEELGAEAVICPADDIVIDDAHQVMTTPGFLAGGSVAEISQGIDKLVTRILGE
jgi:enhancing lycopene biosynthesis protein 2